MELKMKCICWNWYYHYYYSIIFIVEENEKIKILTQGRLSGQNTIKNYLGWERVEEKDKELSLGEQNQMWRV